jgi:hypothetical protein
MELRLLRVMLREIRMAKAARNTADWCDPSIDLLTPKTELGPRDLADSINHDVSATDTVYNWKRTLLG